MKTFAAYILIIVTTLGMGLVYRSARTRPRPEAAVVVPPPQQQPDAPKKESTEPKLNIRTMLPARPEPEPEPAAKATPPEIKTAVAKAKQPDPAVVRRQRAAQYWQRMAQRFEQQQIKLNRENDQARRLNLIKAMAANVRIDTLSTLDWAMSLLNPQEKRAALEAINKNALTGIGAKIELDKTGLPKIRETTILSAAASTGQVEPGDYISGIVNEDGSTIYFKDRPIQQIVQYLRGQSGTEIRLLMERVPTAGSTQPIPFDVLVQRSMIVMQPPF